MPKYKTRYGQPGLYNSSLPTIPDEHGGALAVDANGRLLLSSSSGASAPATTIGDGLKLVTTAGTRETLVASTTPCRSVCITAKISNTGTVVVGAVTVVAASGATRRGTPLNAGDSVTIAINDLVKIYLDVTVNGEGVTYTYTV